VASSFLGRHPNFRLVRNGRNLGCVPTLNRGLVLARGSIVYFGAADDLTEPTLFARGVALLENYPQAALFSARSYVIDAKGQGLGVIPTPIPLPVPGILGVVGALLAVCLDEALDEFVDIARLG